jgi:hypothetical protein
MATRAEMSTSISLAKAIAVATSSNAKTENNFIVVVAARKDSARYRMSTLVKVQG